MNDIISKYSILLTEYYLRVYQKLMKMEEQEELKKELTEIYERELKILTNLYNKDCQVIKIHKAYISAKVLLMLFEYHNLERNIKTIDDFLNIRDDDEDVIVLDQLEPNPLILTTDDINKIVGGKSNGSD